MNFKWQKIWINSYANSDQPSGRYRCWPSCAQRPSWPCTPGRWSAWSTNAGSWTPAAPSAGSTCGVAWATAVKSVSHSLNQQIFLNFLKINLIELFLTGNHLTLIELNQKTGKIKIGFCPVMIFLGLMTLVFTGGLLFQEVRVPAD